MTASHSESGSCTSSFAAATTSSSAVRRSINGLDGIIRSRPSSPAPPPGTDTGEQCSQSSSEYKDKLPHYREPFLHQSSCHGNGPSQSISLSSSLHSGGPGPSTPNANGHTASRARRHDEQYPAAYIHGRDERVPLLISPAASTSRLHVATSRPDAVDRPGTPLLQQEYLSMPHFYDEDKRDDQIDDKLGTDTEPASPGLPTFLSTERYNRPLRAPTLRSRFILFWRQFFSVIISSLFLLLIVVWALTSRSLGYVITTLQGKRKPRYPRAWDNPERWKKEALVKDVKYYARSCGYDIEDQEIVTEDGYKMRVHKVIVPSQWGKTHADGRGGFPVIIQHGLFQSSGSFITSEERSLAFWLADHGGYQVYLGNNRGVFDMGHVSLKRSDPRFWDYNIRDLAMYDLPALVDHVRAETGYDKVAFIGHSQGNATMFVSLARGMVPDLGSKLSVFIALSPAVFAGPLTEGFPFTAIKHMDWRRWKRIFGVMDFIPVMRWAYDYTPGLPFALLGYQMFAFLFQWTDANWLLRRKPKMFRFTPSSVPSAGIFWWTGLNGFSTRGCVLNPEVTKWWDKTFPPLALYHGGKDYLVLCDQLLERLKTHEPDVNVIRIHELEEGEHCDNFWDVDAVENSFVHILEDIEKTRPRYPEELASLALHAAHSESQG